MRLMRWLLLLALFGFPAEAPAQISGGTAYKVVTTCGTLVPAYAAGSVNTPTMDVNGNTCAGVTATISPPVGGFSTAANQTNGSQKTQVVDGSGNVIGSTSNNLNVQCANCSGSGASAVDEASFTAGSSVFAPSGGFFQTTATNNPLTDGQQGLLQLTAQRAAFVNLRNASGTEIGTTTTPVQVSVANTGANATAIKVNVASGGIASGAVASGAYAAGSIAAGAYVSGSILSGALASGAVVDLTNLSTPIAPNTATATKGILLGGQYDSTQKTLTNGQQAGVSLSPRGAIFVATGADPFTITGAGGTFPVTQSTSPWIVAGGGTAGSAATGVVTVQGIASMTPVNVAPQAKTTTEAKVTISVTNTYQQALASSASRAGCTLQYIAVAGVKAFVFFGSAPADTTTSFQLSPGQTISCNMGGVGGIATDAVQVTATATDIFVVSNQ